jgi:glycosyltransferase involved in cell wall biosynthesis
LNLSIIIPTHNRNAQLLKLVKSLDASDLRSFPYEILVVSNFEDLELQAALVGFGATIYLNANKLGANSARNLGLQHARGEIVLFLDDDCVVNDSSLVARHMQLHQGNSEYTGHGGVYWPGPGFTTWGLAHWEAMMRWLVDVDDLSKTFKLIGGHCSYRRSELGSTVFDSSIVYGGAEVSFNEDLYFQGKKFALWPELRVTHNACLTQDEMESKCILQAKNFGSNTLGPRSEFYRKNQDPYRPRRPRGFIENFLEDLAPQEIAEFLHAKDIRSRLFASTVSEVVREGSIHRTK